jgi:hypothetical protein
MAWLAALGALSPPWLIGFAFAMGIGSALDEPLWQALTAEVVPRSVLPAAVTLGGVSMNLARSLGPALGGAGRGARRPGGGLWAERAHVPLGDRCARPLASSQGHHNGARRALGWRHGGGASLRAPHEGSSCRPVSLRRQRASGERSGSAAPLVRARRRSVSRPRGSGSSSGAWDSGRSSPPGSSPRSERACPPTDLLTLGALAFAGALVALYAAGALILAASGWSWPAWGG